MASIVLSSIGSSIGIGGVFGKLAGSFVGRSIDTRLFGGNSNYNTHSPRLKDLSIQSSSYGSMIPIIYGTVRTAGNIIWAKELKEKATNTNSSARTKGGKVNRTHTDYNYFASLAISICEGEIEDVLRIWADDKLLDLSLYNIRIYKGSETQKPDPLLESVHCIGNTPSYRGQAYVVLEDFPLAEFNNRLPNFNFEVKRNIRTSNILNAEEKIESVVIIPGGGEFVYDTVSQTKIKGVRSGKSFSQSGKNISLNQHTHYGKANALVSLDQLKSTLPNVKWAAVVVNWFGTSLDAAICKIVPGVEFKDGATTSPDIWSVANYSRETAHQITKENSKPIYGGTVNDASLVRYLNELKTRGYNVMLYPMIFMDAPGKPWRGRITGDANSVKNFFNTSGYNEFIKHYAALTHGIADAFLIGSELIGLTKVIDSENHFPAVDALINLSSEVKQITHINTKISYAADWSEYHHTTNGWYNLDKLWASKHIDFIGIDAYFPLSNSNESIYDISKIMSGWESGEGFDFCYNNRIPCSIPQQYAWKNIKWWWENEHINPDGMTTNWVPKSKKIWFTEYGFPSVDCCTNQPNIFFDQSSTESKFPIHSKGSVDYKAQRAAIMATELFWENSEVVENKFLWTWDARPYPYWPDDLHIWSDGSSYHKGHWVQGKLGTSKLSDIIIDLAKHSGLYEEKIHAESLIDSVEGLIIDSKQSSRSIIDLLKNIYFFDAVERDGKIHFEKRESKESSEIKEFELVDEISISNTENNDLPNKVDVNFLNSSNNYLVGNRHCSLPDSKSNQSINLNFPVVMSESFAQAVAEITLYDLWQQGSLFSFSLPPKYCYLCVGDVIKIQFNNKTYVLRINSIHLGANLVSKITAVSEELSIYKTASSEIVGRTESMEPLSKTRLEILDIPYIIQPEKDNDSYVYLAACGYGKNWDGAKIFMTQYEGGAFEEIAEITTGATIGNVISELKNYEPSQIDYSNKILITLIHGQLESVNDELFISGYNKALIGNEIIFFKQAKLIAPFQYEISILIRGMYGTEEYISNHKPGERFVLLDQNITKLDVPIEYIGKTTKIKAVTFKDSIGNTNSLDFCFEGKCLKPYSPVNIKINNTTISWTRRSRITHFLPNYLDAPMGELFEKYSVDAFDGNCNLLLSTETSNTEITLEHKPHSITIKQLSGYA